MKIARNEPVIMDYAGVYNGYVADKTRIFSIGKIDPVLEDAHYAALKMQMEKAKEIKSGRTGRDIFARSEAEGLLRGFQEHLGVLLEPSADL